MQHMTEAITPPEQKLKSKGVDSVRQHITTLCQHTLMSLEQVKRMIVETLCDKTITLHDDELLQIEKIEAEYHTEQFIFGNNPLYNTTCKQRIEGVGEVEINMVVKGNVIQDINMVGDFFLLGDIETNIIQPLKGCHLTQQALYQALPDNVDDTIRNLNKQDLIAIILQ